MTGPVTAPEPQVWWELVDPAAAPDEHPAGVAVTCDGPELMTQLEAVAAATPQDQAVVGQLVDELVAALRRTDACWVVVQAGDPDLVALLLGEGFEFTQAGRADGRLVLPL